MAERWGSRRGPFIVVLMVWQTGALIHVFTSEMLDRDLQPSIALKPVELIIDALNQPDCHDARTLVLGTQWICTFGVETTAD